VPAGRKADPPEGKTDEASPAGTALAPAAGVTRRPSCSRARFVVCVVTETDTEVKHVVT
jgi:hypothetical protein